MSVDHHNVDTPKLADGEEGENGRAWGRGVGGHVEASPLPKAKRGSLQISPHLALHRPLCLTVIAI